MFEPLCEEVSFFWDECPRVQLLGPMIKVHVNFSLFETAELSPKVAVFPPACMCSFSRSSPAFGVVTSFYCSHSVRCVVRVHYGNLWALITVDRK